MQLQITDIDYSRIIVVFVKNRLFTYSSKLREPNPNTNPNADISRNSDHHYKSSE